jgi:hypothetical protein
MHSSGHPELLKERNRATILSSFAKKSGGNIIQKVSRLGKSKDAAKFFRAIAAVLEEAA